MIAVGQKLPAGVLSELSAEGMSQHQVHELFAGKRAVLFAVPGAFTPTCSETHLPGYVVYADQLQAKGVDLIACVSVNDAFVMRAWGQANNAEAITMLADGDGSFAKSLGLSMDTAGFGGTRSQRYAMVIDDGVVTGLFVEPEKSFGVSSAEAVLASL
ncbi:peroxiredoxin [Shewanella sp. NIFS-20-20]|uniref:peroxiredoxin n=1 Tax=Shewanella sp. NIFS-20-20 TaxID=2853806 RepID=UPI001C43A3F9|nr:peroxiredoxin [Shewanella sp. NIFS-20-20]MBV7317302.1 peroxiredoxin [Shewanella sp. NIFS-20-20]